MQNFTIRGFGEVRLEHLVLDYNGTIALDGRLLLGIPERLFELAKMLRIHVLTANTHGNAHSNLEDIPANLVILDETDQAEAKRGYIESLGAASVVAIGNGRNDALMLKAARIGILVVQKEGAATEALVSSDIVVSSALDALNLLTNPQRIVATLRS